MMKRLSIAMMVFVLVFAGCQNGAGPDNNTNNTNSGNKTNGLQADITLNAYMGNTQYSIALNAQKGTFKATPKTSLNSNQVLGREADTTAASEITGTFVCNKTSAGDDLYWYAHNSAICLKPDTVTASTGTDKNCYKIIADLTKITGTDGTATGTEGTATGTDGTTTGSDTNVQTVEVTNKYCTSAITAADYTAAETKAAADATKPSATTVTFTEAQKKCLTKANTELADCTTATVSDLTQEISGNTETVGFTFDINGKDCNVFIDKDKVAISTDDASDFSRSTPTWLMDAVDAIITSGASPDDITNCAELKDCTALQSVITELASAVGQANDEVVYTESGKDGYKELPCPWTDAELTKIKAFTENYSSHKLETGAICHPCLGATREGYNQVIEKFADDSAFAKDSNGNRTASELVYIFAYDKIAEVIGDNNYYTEGEEIFGLTITVDLEALNAALPTFGADTNPEILFDYFTFSEAPEYTSTDPVTWRKITDAKTNQDTIEPVYHYEATPDWFLDMINTYTDPSHSDYDRQFNIGGSGCPISYIGSVWLDDLCREYLYGPNYNTGYDDLRFVFDVYEKDLSTDSYPPTPTEMEINTIRKMVDSCDYEAYTAADEETWMSNYWEEYKAASEDADGNTYESGNYDRTRSYTITFHGKKPIYIKKILYNVVYLQRNGETLTETDRVVQLTVSEIKELMKINAGCKLFLWNDDTRQWTGEISNGTWEFYTGLTETETGWGGPTNNTVYFLQTDNQFIILTSCTGCPYS